MGTKYEELWRAIVEAVCKLIYDDICVKLWLRKIDLALQSTRNLKENVKHYVEDQPHRKDELWNEIAFAVAELTSIDITVNAFEMQVTKKALEQLGLKRKLDIACEEEYQYPPVESMITTCALSTDSNEVATLKEEAVHEIIDNEDVMSATKNIRNVNVNV